MSTCVLIGDSHLNRMKINLAVVVARGGLQAFQMNFQFLAQYREYDICFLLVGGNDISPDHYEPTPKTAKQAANHLIRCQKLLLK